MYHTLRRTFGVTLYLLGLMSPRVFAAEPPSTPLLTAQLVAVAGASHPLWHHALFHRRLGGLRAACGGGATHDWEGTYPEKREQA
jgi:hypothetical protein